MANYILIYNFVEIRQQLYYIKRQCYITVKAKYAVSGLDYQLNLIKKYEKENNSNSNSHYSDSRPWFYHYHQYQ